MRILFVNETCGYLGGVEQNIASTVTGLGKTGIKCYLAYAIETQRESARYKQLFSDTLQCSDLVGPESNASGIKFKEIVKRFRPDVIYLHKVPSARFCIPFLGKIRVVRMIHDHDLCCPRRHKYFFRSETVCDLPMGLRCYWDLGFLAKQVGKKMPKFVSIRAKYDELKLHFGFNALLVGSRFMRKELLDNGFAEDIVHIVPPLVPFHVQENPVLVRDPKVLFVGQLIKGKGVDLLLKSLGKLSIPFSAAIVGTGNAEDELRKLCNVLGLDDRVTFKGWIPNNRIGHFYADSRVVVVPSRWPEPFGMIGIEAMHYARPVVAFAVGGIPDWLTDENTGLLVPEQNVSAMTKALHRILTDWHLASLLSSNAKNTVQERFSFSNYLDDIVHQMRG